VPRIASPLQNHIDDTAHGAAMLGLDAAALHFDFVNELERHIGVRVSSDYVGRILSFHQIAVLAIRSAGHLEAQAPTIRRAPRRTTTSSRTRKRSCAGTRDRVITHQRFIAC
jgi:hypothetical protein